MPIIEDKDYDIITTIEEITEFMLLYTPPEKYNTCIVNNLQELKHYFNHLNMPDFCLGLQMGIMLVQYRQSKNKK